MPVKSHLFGELQAGDSNGKLPETFSGKYLYCLELGGNERCSGETLTSLFLTLPCKDKQQRTTCPAWGIPIKTCGGCQRLRDGVG